MQRLEQHRAHDCSQPSCGLQVRHVGVSNETSWGVTQFVAAAERAGLPKIVSIQNSYHLLNRGPFETDLVEVRAAHVLIVSRDAVPCR